MKKKNETDKWELAVNLTGIIGAVPALVAFTLSILQQPNIAILKSSSTLNSDINGLGVLAVLIFGFMFLEMYLSFAIPMDEFKEKQRKENDTNERN